MLEKSKYVLIVLVLVVVMDGCVEKPIPATTTTVISTTTIQPKEVVVSTDKSVYLQRETINFTVTNYLNESVCYRKVLDCGRPFWTIEKELDSGWEDVWLVLYRPLKCFYVDMGPIELKPGESIKGNWPIYKHVRGWIINPHDYTSEEYQVESGKYRFVFYYYFGCGITEEGCDCSGKWNNAQKVYSNEFVIKEGTTTTTTSSTSTTVITYPREIEFETLSNSHRCQGTSNRGIKVLHYVINNESALESIWDIHFNGEFPKIDFSNNTVIAVFWLDVPLGRGNIEITKILDYEDKVLVLHNKAYSPYVGPAHRALRVNPCHIVKTDKVDKEVDFIEDSNISSTNLTTA